MTNPDPHRSNDGPFSFGSINHRFTYHAPFGSQTARYERVREIARRAALELAELCPRSRELSLALDHLDQVVFNANAAIARHERSPDAAKALGAPTTPSTEDPNPITHSGT